MMYELPSDGNLNSSKWFNCDYESAQRVNMEPRQAFLLQIDVNKEQKHMTQPHKKTAVKADFAPDKTTMT